MSDTERLTVAADVFAGDRFWQRLSELADGRGHAGHTRWLVGDTEPDNLYRLWCQRCDVAVVELEVRRDGSPVL